MDTDLDALVRRATGARRVVATQPVQRLWGGYGQILRCRLDGGDATSVIVKHVRWPDERDHPHGWTSDRSHDRKVRSYRVETAWYERYAPRCPDAAPVPRCLATQTRDDGVVLVLEDLDASGFPGRRTEVDAAELDACLAWLAAFHATFLGARPEGLWERGTYWHLATRPDELAALPDGPLKSAASHLDRRLAATRHRTLVHGDAKLANFCFTDDGRRAAAVDFQYVGGGCGIQDVAYFLGSCLDEDECERLAPALLDRYFTLLGDALRAADSNVDVVVLEADWRALYPVAWADFARFLHGWRPGHWKLHRYTEQLVHDALATS